MSDHERTYRWLSLSLLLALASPAVASAQQDEAEPTEEAEAAAPADPQQAAGAEAPAAAGAQPADEEEEGEAPAEGEQADEPPASRSSAEAAAPGGSVAGETSAPREDPGAEVLTPGGTLEEDLAAAEAEQQADDEGAEEGGGGGGRTGAWNATLDWDHSMTLYTLNPGAQLAYNPTYSWTWTAWGSYWVTHDLRVRGRIPVNIELTPSDTTTTSREIWFNDIVLDAIYVGLPEIPGLFYGVGGRVQLPVSQSSLAAGRILGLSVFAFGLHAFPIGGHSLIVSGGGGYQRWLATRDYVAVDEPFRCRVLSAGLTVTQQCTQFPGPSPVRDSLSFSLSAMYMLGRVMLGTSFAWQWDYGFGLADAVVEVDGAPGGVVVLEDGSVTHMRGSTLFSLSGTYGLTPNVNLTLAFSTPAPHLDTDGKPENPFWNERSMLTATVSVGLGPLQSMVAQAQGGQTTEHHDEGEEGDGGEPAGSEESQ